MNTLRENLKALSEAVAVAGDEAEVRQYIRDQIKDHVSSITIDAMGNLDAKLNSSGQSPLKVMISAHMDETGLMVSDISSSGTLSVMAVGRLDMRFLAGARVLVGKDKQPGVIQFAPIHKTHGQNSVPEVDALTVDVGASTKSGAKAKPGDRIAFMGDYRELTATVVRGKALRGRAGCAVLIEVIRALNENPLPYEVHAVFTAQAMVFARGAKVAAQRIQPHFAMTLYGANCNDLPRTEFEDDTPLIAMGDGPTLGLADVWLIADRRAAQIVQDVAVRASVPLQIDSAPPLRTEGSAVASVVEGVPTAIVGIPVRYMEGPNALINLDDLEHTARLLNETLRTLTPELLKP